MKRFLIALTVTVVTVTTPALATEMDLSLSIGQPGFYGQIDIGDYPPPQVLYRRPIMIERGSIERPPIYLRVPPEHAKDWRKHCHKYNACGERVLFVQDNWYQREYVPRYQERHGNHQNDRRDEGKDHRRDDRGSQKKGHPGNDRDHGRNR